MDPRQGLPTATHHVDNGAADFERDNGVAGIARTDDAREAEPVDRDSDSLESGHLESDSVPDDHVRPDSREDDHVRTDSREDDHVRTDSREDEDDDLGPDAFDDHDDGAPPPLEHAAPDVELAEEQLAYGRPGEPEPDEEEDEEEFEREVEESIAAGRGGRGGRRRGGYGAGGASGGGELAAPSGTAIAERHPSVLARLIGFLQGSWRELHRVHWPDRREVFQFTGIVIGFVILAAVFLGAADWVSGKLVTFVLK